MRILFLNDFIPPRNIGGPGKRSFELAKEFAKMGNEVYFITSCQNKCMEGEEMKNGIKIFNVYSRYPVFFRYYFCVYNFMVVAKIKSLIKNIRPDIVHADNIHTHISYVSLKAAKKSAKAVFLTSRDFMLLSYGKFFPKHRECGEINYKIKWTDNLKQAKKRFNPFRNSAIKKYLKYADKIFVVSCELEKALNQNGIRNTEVVYNGLSIDDSAGKQAIGYDSKTIFLYGRINEAKGVYAILDVLPDIKLKIPDVKLIIAGVANEEKIKISKYINNAGLNNIEIFGWVDEKKISDILDRASVIVSPSLCFDSFPGVNLEAALHRKPVVTTCFGGAKEFIIDGETGYVVNPFNKSELSEKIIELLSDEKKAESFGMANFERLKNDFSLEKQARIVLNWYEKIIHKNAEK